MARRQKRQTERAATRSASPAAPLTSGALSTSTIALISLALVALTIAVYAAVRHFDFVPVDDPLYVSENPHLIGGLTWANVSWAFTSQWAGYWIPFVWLSYMFEVTCAGVDPGVMHMTNVVLHAVNAVLVFVWLRKMTGSMWRSAFVAALFAVHPLHVESVAWITERKDVLSTLFLLLALVAYASWVRHRSTTRFLMLCTLFIAGLLAKPMLVTLPIVMLLLDVWPLGRVTFAADQWREWRRLTQEKLLFFGLTIAGAAIAVVEQRNGGALASLSTIPLHLRIENAVVSCVWYLVKTVWPTNLIVIYEYPASIPAWKVIGAALVLIGITVAAFRTRRQRPYFLVGWLWYVVTLLPVIGVVQVGLQPMADRFTYVPLIGIFVIVAWGVPDLIAGWSSARRVLAASAIAVTMALGVVAHAQVQYWQDGSTLWGHALEVTKGVDSYRAHIELGTTLRDQHRTDEAIASFSEAVRVKPDAAEGHYDLAQVLATRGSLDDAITQYTDALRLDPRLPEVQNNLGTLLANQHRFEEAVVHFRAAVDLKPDFDGARMNLALALVRVGRVADAVTELTNLLARNPSNDAARRLLGSLTRGR